jgi:hypothetical protein
MKRLIIIAVSTFVLATPAGASSDYRFRLKPGNTKAGALRLAERRANRTVGFSGADCWMYDGNVRIGWHHAACVGNYTYNGTAYRFKATWTPISCTKERVVIVIPGQTTQRSTIPVPKNTGFKVC